MSDPLPEHAEKVRLRDQPVATPDPMPVATVQVVTAGMVCWAVALVVTLVVPSLHTGERSWWPWTCVTALALGAMGLAFVRRGRGNFEDVE
ncbi:MAG: DUF2530 domain-containing protein [Micrococcales bacterium]|nr:DUF2530 domain-containing protein [Micrococcales bacterium]